MQRGLHFWHSELSTFWYAQIRIIVVLVGTIAASVGVNCYIQPYYGLNGLLVRLVYNCGMSAVLLCLLQCFLVGAAK